MGAAVRITGVEEHIVLKIIFMEDDHDDPFIILMNGDKKGLHEDPWEGH